MFDNLLGKNGENIELRAIDQRLKKAFSNVKKEFDEHLDAINENTNEIQSNYEALLKLETKLENLANRLNEVEIFIKQFKSQNVYFIDDESNTFNILPLNEREKMVFKLIYELEAENVKVSYSKLAEVLGISTSLIREYVVSLIEKGVPIMKNYLNQKVYISLEPKFKELQTKKNIVNI